MDIAYSALTGHYYLTEGRKRVDITEPMLAHDARKRAEVVDECVRTIRNFAPDCVKLIEQLKEQKNDC